MSHKSGFPPVPLPVSHTMTVVKSQLASIHSVLMCPGLRQTISGLLMCQSLHQTMKTPAHIVTWACAHTHGAGASFVPGATATLLALFRWPL